MTEVRHTHRLLGRKWKKKEEDSGDENDRSESAGERRLMGHSSSRRGEENNVVLCTCSPILSLAIRRTPLPFAGCPLFREQI